MLRASLPDLSPTVSSIYPVGGRPGETLQVDMSGRRLDGTLEVTFGRPDIKAELISSNSNSTKIKVTVGPAVPTGLHDYRLKTPNGAFVGVFHVGTLPGGREVEPNDDIRGPENHPSDDGWRIGGPDFDVYGFHAEEGQTLIFDVLGRRAGSSLDANLGLLDERGNELDFNDDYYIHKDPQVTFAVKRTGDYFIRVGGQGEGRRGGGGAASYRLLAGAFPLIRRVLPAGARRGATTELRAAGVNLQGVDRVVLGDGLAEGKVVAATAELLTVRFDVPASFPPVEEAAAAGKTAPLPFSSDLEEKLSWPQPTDHSRRTPLYNGVLDRRRRTLLHAGCPLGARSVFDVDP
jgi:hypothetical protein